MPRNTLLNHAHDFVRQHLQAGGIAVDATIGNGYDTLFLAQNVGEGGCVYGFDIQPQAIAKTQARLCEAGLDARCRLLHVSHQHWPEYLPGHDLGRVQAVMFNLGYLPGSDKRITTQAQSTLAALDASLNNLERQGVISVLAYPGHIGGEQEAGQVMLWFDGLDTSRCRVAHQPGIRPNAPMWFGVQKIR
ncbi:MAG: class I SAM-dependent methyltransferase [Methylococcales bacterium]|nr:class I SAM-dependent methyltransferase [Methylococcales bacterium]